MKGIVLAGGTGSRLFPLTLVTSKQLLPVFDKPMVYYPLSVLMLAGLKEVLIISTPADLPRYRDLLGDGSELGMKLSYVVQDHPGGVAQAFLLADQLLNGQSVCLVLGDTVFHGHGLTGLLRESVLDVEQQGGGVVFGYPVQDPQRYGVLEIDRRGRLVSIEEKPESPKSNRAMVGLYFFDGHVVEVARKLKPSARGELEVTDVARDYLERGRLRLENLGRGYAWLDTGTPEALLQASNFVQTIEQRQGLKVACIEEIAFHSGWIGVEQLEARRKRYGSTAYGRYLSELADGGGWH